MRALRLRQHAASEVAADQLAVSELLDEPDAVRKPAASDDVQHVGGGQDLVIATAEPDRPRERVDVPGFIYEADVAGRFGLGEMSDAGGVHS
jgi:hypothetical protein